MKQYYRILRNVAEGGSATAPLAPSAPGAAPVAPEAPKPLTTLADFERMARESLQVAPPDAPPAPAAPVAPAAPESPAAPSEPPAAEPSGQPDEAEPEPTPEELASLGDAGKRALESERTKRKEARAELKAAQEKIAELEAKLVPPQTPVAPSAPETPAVVPQQPTPPPPAAVPQNLAACQTFAQVEAVAMQAIRAEEVANELIMAMNAGDRTAVLEGLKAEGVTAIGPTPLEQADDAALRSTLARALAGAKLTQKQAPHRSAYLHNERLSYGEATKLLPGLTKAGSPELKAFEAALNANPNVRTLGPNWPLLLAQNVAFTLGRSNTATAPMLPAPPAATPTPRSAPAAPRASAAVVPPPNEGEQLAAKFKNGSATKDDMEKYARLSLRIG